MMDVLFFLKTLALTIVFVLLLQIKIGEKSIETHAHDFVQTSSLVEPLNQAAFGAAQLIRDVASRATLSIRQNLGSKQKPDADGLRPKKVSDQELKAADGPRGH